MALKNTRANLSENELRQSLKDLLKGLPPEQIWRPVLDAEGGLIFEGCGFMEDSMGSPSGIDFKGKSVADLGCNMGYYAFQAHDEGAARVVGYDIDTLIIKAANLLAALKRTPSVAFICKDIQLPPGVLYDIAMLLDVIGKQTIAKGALNPLLDGLSHYSDTMLILTLRRSYRIMNDLKTDPESLVRLYGKTSVCGNKFMLLDHVVSYYADKWRILPELERDKEKPDHTKIMARFVPLNRPGKDKGAEDRVV